MKNYKEILEANKETKEDPLVIEWEDAKSKVMMGHVALHTAASLHKFKPKDVTKAKGFYSGSLIKIKSEWSSLEGYVWIQISQHSKFKE